MSDELWTALLEEYVNALNAAQTPTDEQNLRIEIQQRLEQIASSLDLLMDLNQARKFITDGPESDPGVSE